MSLDTKLREKKQNTEYAILYRDDSKKKCKTEIRTPRISAIRSALLTFLLSDLVELVLSYDGAPAGELLFGIRNFNKMQIVSLEGWILSSFLLPLRDVYGSDDVNAHVAVDHGNHRIYISDSARACLYCYSFFGQILGQYRFVFAEAWPGHLEWNEWTSELHVAVIRPARTGIVTIKDPGDFSQPIVFSNLWPLDSYALDFSAKKGRFCADYQLKVWYYWHSAEKKVWISEVSVKTEIILLRSPFTCADCFNLHPNYFPSNFRHVMDGPRVWVACKRCFSAICFNAASELIFVAENTNENETENPFVLVYDTKGKLIHQYRLQQQHQEGCFQVFAF